MSPRVLLHPLADRQSRRSRPTRRVLAAHRAKVRPDSTAEPAISRERRDIAVERVRSAGGPLDEASYTCQCGYLFAAPVTTTVACPHCGTDQAW